jgi:hypothetical protein
MSKLALEWPQIEELLIILHASKGGHDFESCGLVAISLLLSTSTFWAIQLQNVLRSACTAKNTVRLAHRSHEIHRHI